MRTEFEVCYFANVSGAHTLMQVSEFCMSSGCLSSPLSGCADGGVGHRTPQYFQIRKKVGQKSAMLQEIWSQYFL